MSGWVRFENTTPENLKVAPITDKAFRLWFNAISYCSRNQTDGRVPAAIITRLSPSATARTVAELLDAGLLREMDARTYLVHDYLDYNPSRDRIKEMREGTKRRVQRSREQRDGNAVTGEDVTALQDRNSRGRDRTDTYSDSVLSLSRRLAALISRNDPKAKPQPDSERWLTDMRLLVDDRNGDVAEVERVIDWCQSDSFWRSNILSPGKLRKQFTQLLLRASAGNVQPLRRENASDWLREINRTEEVS